MSKYALGNLLELKRGQDLTKNDMCKGIYPVVGSNGIIGMHNVFNVKAPCITVGRSGTVGAVHYYNENCWAHNTCLYVSDFKNNNPLYLYYLLKNIDLTKVATSTGVPTLNRNFVYPITTTATVNLNEQNNIANILGAIDEKIENNNAITAQLESLAKTIYNYWFLQFEFPNEEGKPYKSSGGKMVWNEELKREIPEGWEVTSISTIASLYQPQTITDSDFVSDGKYSVYGANGIVGKYNKYNHENREIALCCRGANCGNYLMTKPYSWITGNSMVVKPKIEVFKEYIYYFLSKDKISPFITGSAQPQITRTNLENLKIIIPDDKSISKFNTISLDYRKMIERLLTETQQLTSLRDFLLPLLMNGQVTFKEEAASEEE